MKKSPVQLKANIKTVAILGTGLIGGSIGLALKAARKKYKVIGIGRRWSTLRLAKKIGAVDQITLSLEKGLKEADLVILAAPVGIILRQLKLIPLFVKPGAIVTDAGSTKAHIVRTAEKVLKGKAFFVGSHPMAGSEKTGVAAAKPDIFKNSMCLVTKTLGTNKQALQIVSNFWKQLGADIRVLSPSVHDLITAGVSHLPHMVSVALCRTLTPGQIDYAAGGFKDTTRIALSDAGLWADICFSNSAQIQKSVRLFIKQLFSLEKYLKTGDKRKFIKFWEKANQIRKKCG